MLWQAKLLWNCSAKMRHARMEKINVVYSNNGWNVRIVAKYNFLIPVRAPSLPAQPATSPGLTKSLPHHHLMSHCPPGPGTITLSPLLTADSRYHCVARVEHRAVQCWAGVRGAAAACWLTGPGCCCPHQLRPAAPPARTSPHSCRSLPGVSWPSWSRAAEYHLNICINVASIIMVEIWSVFLIQRVLLDIW